MRRSIIALSKKTTIVSVPMNLGQPNLGLDLAPRAIIDSGLPKLLESEGWKWREAPPLTDNFNNLINSYRSSPAEAQQLNAKNCLQVGKVSKLIHDSVLESFDEDKKAFPLILGGDHCISIGTISAIAKVNPGTGIVWVDAHADINTPETSGSGNMHGMPLAFLLGLIKNPSSLPGFEWFKPPATLNNGESFVKPEDIVYIGLRDLDVGEKNFIKSLGIKAYTMHDVDRYGIGRVVEETVEHLKNKEKIHLSFDIDALDPMFAPHTGTAVTGGLTYREGNFICEGLAATGKLSSAEVVEVDPTRLHPSIAPEQTVNTALTLISSIVGKTIL